MSYYQNDGYAYEQEELVYDDDGDIINYAGPPPGAQEYGYGEEYGGCADEELVYDDDGDIINYAGPPPGASTYHNNYDPSQYGDYRDASRSSSPETPRPETPIVHNLYGLTSNCFYVTAGSLLDMSSRDFASLCERMQPSNYEAGELLSIMEEACDTTGLRHSRSGSPRGLRRYGVGYIRPDGSGHCVICVCRCTSCDDWCYVDYQDPDCPDGFVVRGDDISANNIQFYFWNPVSEPAPFCGPCGGNYFVPSS